MEDCIGDFFNSSGHSVFGVNCTNDCGPTLVTAFILNAYAFYIGNGNEILPNLFCKSAFIKLVTEDCICLAESVEPISCDCTKATNTKSGAWEWLTLNHSVGKT